MWTMIASAVFFAMGYLISWYVHTPEKNQYRWKCMVEGCTFECSSPNSAEVVLRFADAHARTHAC